MSKKDEIKLIGARVLFIAFLLVVSIMGSIPQSLALFQTHIIPHPSYTVYIGESYTLTVDVQYDIPNETSRNIGPIELWVSSPPYASDKVQLEGKGVYSFKLKLVAPGQVGDHALEIQLHANSKQHKSTVIETATIKYKVTQPTLNDWAITKVWIKPESPVRGDEVTFHATVELKSTTYKELELTQTARVGFYLDGNFFSGVFLRQKLVSHASVSQDIRAYRMWTAEEGSHGLRVAVEDNNNYPDPFTDDNTKEIVFSASAPKGNLTTIVPEPVKEESPFKLIDDFFEWVIKFFKELFS